MVLVDFLNSVLKLIVEAFGFLSTSFINGIQFFIALFTNIPNLLLDLFYELPDFVQVGLSGTLGFICLVAILKIVSLVKLSG